MKMKGWNDIVVHEVAPALRRDFKAICIVKGYTMREAVIWFATQVQKGKIQLPEKQEAEAK